MTDTPAPVPEKEITSGDLQKLTHLYQVPFSESTLKEIAGDSQATPQKAQALEEYLKMAASGLYPTLAPQIQAGIPTAHLLDPYRQVGKQVLGDNYEPDFQANLHDRAALEGHVDPKTGRPGAMSLSQWAAHLRSDPYYGWQNTPEAQDARLAVKLKMVNAMRGK